MIVDAPARDCPILGNSPKIIELCRVIKKVSGTDSILLVQGESGTGKELVADAIYKNSLRNNKPFIKINCAALSETLLESELFGHKKGAFTGACESRDGRFKLAHGGTILLDEIGTMSLYGQAKLLRVIQENEIIPVGSSMPIKIDVRVIATTNVHLKKATEEGVFREDLFYRLSVVTLFLPSLRERKEDIPVMIRSFIESANLENRRHIKGVSPEAMASLMSYDWPGNVRELKNAIEQAVIIETNHIIQVQSLPQHILYGSWNNSFKEYEDFNLKNRLKTYERQIILRALIKANRIKCKAAELLGIDQRNLSYFIHKHNILNQDIKEQTRTLAS